MIGALAALALAGSVCAQSITNPPGSGGGAPATGAANTILANPTGSSGSYVAHAAPSCSGATDALIWTTSTGLGCHSISGGGGATLGANTFTETQTITPAAGTSALVSTGYNLTSGTTAVVDLAGTLNNGSTNFDWVAFRATITGTGSSTKLLNIYGGGSGTTSVFSVDKIGTVTVGAGLSVASTSALSFSSRTKLFASADGELRIRNNAQSQSFILTAAGADATPVVQLGATDAAAPVAQVLRAQGVATGTSDTAGPNFTVQTPVGTGTGGGGAFIIQTAPKAATSSTPNTVRSVMSINHAGHINSLGTIPALSNCGTSPAITTGSTDTAGEVTEGSGASACTITFATAYAAAPFCTVTSQGGLVFSYAVSTTAIIVTNVGALSSTKLNYHCMGA
ncbi:hypothetical protein [Phenylobacterium sp.]|uniref:hypothetical protein n=1 Tax=Phenylobacterium sp. TaxID=1871053 RepID=UPI002736F16D|nr:hypothetical protein [Phenylobacterium sp.]MDP3853143.1 hypothetical protein [Phenylobacterium sp.]